MQGESSSLKRFIFWDYPRAGWQYDVMVGLILAFIFLTPREWFRDQPRASSIVVLPAERDANVYLIEPELLAGVPDNALNGRAEELLKNHTKTKQSLIRLQPIRDAENEVKGYMAYTKR